MDGTIRPSTSLTSENVSSSLIRRQQRSRTIDSEFRKVRPVIASPFMPVPVKIPNDWDCVSTSHLGNGPKDRKLYGSVSSRADAGGEHRDSGDESATDDEGEENSSDVDTFLSKFTSLTAKEWITICMLATANLGSTTAFSCIAPFYPNEAKSKGLNNFETGIVFGVFELIMFIAAPFFGKYMSYVGSKTMFTAGIFVTGITAILFGFLKYTETAPMFFYLSLAIRIAEALGDAAFVTSSFAIGAKCFPARIATVIGLMEAFAGLGFTAGPPLGGVLYQLGGFLLPFVVLGSILIIVAILSYILVENVDDETKHEGKGMLQMMKIPVVWVMIYAVVVCAVSLSFLDPTLANHLESFSLSPSVIGLLFLLCGGIYTMTAPIWGIVIDKFTCNKAIILFGSASTVVAMLLIGPAPFLNSKKDLMWIAFALGILGLSSGALYIPTFQTCIDAVRNYGYDESLHTYGCVSGLFQSAFSFGSFFGPTVGGLFVEWFGFPWAATAVAIVHALFMLIMILFFLRTNLQLCTQKSSRSR